MNNTLRTFALPITLLFLASVAVADDPINIGSRRELLVDQHVIDKMTDVRLVLHHPTPREIALVHDKPWEGSGSMYHSVFQDGDRYRMYYYGWQATVTRGKLIEPHEFVTCYAESRDGVDWTKPELGLIGFEGSKQNNIVLANNPWDTHCNHFPLIKNSLIPRADQTLAALLADLSDRGLLDETLVVWMGEFGRSPRISKMFATPGREHWPHAFTILMAGAGIRGGSVHGATDRNAEFVTDDPVSPADVTATIFDAMGIDPKVAVPSRNPQHQLSTGRPLGELFV